MTIFYFLSQDSGFLNLSLISTDPVNAIFRCSDHFERSNSNRCLLESLEIGMISFISSKSGNILKPQDNAMFS